MERLRVRVIDDSLTLRALVEEIVERDRDFAAVTVAADATQARALMPALRPHIITLDLEMPGIGGLHFLDELRDQAHAPIVVLSSATREGSASAAEALEHGADYCFDKAKLISEARRFVGLLKKAARRKVAKNGLDYQPAMLADPRKAASAA